MKGSVIGQLFHRAFPGFFPYNSLHLWQPFHIPVMNYVLSKLQGYLPDLETLSELDLDAQTIQAIESTKAVQMLPINPRGAPTLQSRTHGRPQLNQKLM